MRSEAHHPAIELRNGDGPQRLYKNSSGTFGQVSFQPRSDSSAFVISLQYRGLLQKKKKLEKSFTVSYLSFAPNLPRVRRNHGNVHETYHEACTHILGTRRKRKP